ncbi:hypothetical protein [Brevundimonas guildfordensis]|uniref:Lipoprotein n=1 Tax=Brevundimonas guildfordensis TaxID=2762241 RepID=A0ABR8R3R9_9CAUL|nr:hypothetical protein [Brevundimonas guildfordensis]MBD7942428.1 hypothetical protein [Brevundimonas guildfordensis]
MRAPLLFAAALVAPLTLAACASGRSLPTYQQEMDKLDSECRDRGGIISPTGRQTGRPQTDYVCKITGGATRIPRG